MAVSVKFSLFERWNSADMFESLGFFDDVDIYCKERFSGLNSYRFPTDYILVDRIIFEDEIDAVAFILGFS
jgi:hypothetical protein